MYSEKSFKRQLFWIKAKRVFFMLIFSIIGSAIGVAISSYMIDVLLFDVTLRPIIITCSTIILFFISLLITSNTGKEIQDGYWKIAVLKKLTVISKKLDNLENLKQLENLQKLDELCDLLINLKNDNTTIEESVTEEIPEKNIEDIQEENHSDEEIKNIEEDKKDEEKEA